MIIKVKPDKQKATALMQMAKITLERLNELDKEKYHTNTLIDYYEVIRKIMEALVSLEGSKTKGEGAHQVLIDYICKQYHLGEFTRQFLQEIRDYRNKISYEGFIIKEDYVKKNSKRIQEIINKLMDIIKENIN